jgi:hypothetical protein
MRKRSFRFGGVVVLVVAISVAAVLAWAGRSRAASGNICAVPTVGTGTNLSESSCVTERTAPHFSSGGSAVSVTKFFNGSGSGGATATHTVISVTFPSAVTVTGITVSATNGAGNSNCTPSTLPQSVMTVSCSVGNIAGGGSVRLAVAFTASGSIASCPAGTGTIGACVYGAASYGEGPGNPSGVPNDFQVGYDHTPLSVGTATADGGCFSLGPKAKQSLSGGNTSQKTNATIGQGGDLPCTFADVGVNGKQSGFSTLTSFVEFPTMTSGFATVSILFTPLPSGLHWNTFPLWEWATYDPSTNTVSGSAVQVQACDTVTYPATGGVAPGADSCIFSRSTLPKGGAEIDLHVTGSPFDSGYAG